MGRIAILGATSHLAKDLIASLAGDPGAEAVLFARHPQEVERWAMQAGFGGRFPASDYAAFGGDTYDAIINFVGVGDPARIAQTGSGIFDITLRFDQLALDYLRDRPDCRYLFLSSGAVYGGTFEQPAEAATPSCLAINALPAREYYAAAKLHAECRHRSLAALPIIDIRVFSYFSRTLDLSTRFFMADILRSIRAGRTLETTAEPMVRDFLHPRDFAALVRNLLAAPAANATVDCYSLGPVAKDVLLARMRMQFGLDYVFVSPPALASGGGKKQYYSLNRKAAEFGYRPACSSLQCVVEEAACLLAAG